MRSHIAVVFFVLCTSVQAQGDLEYLKTQLYLDHYRTHPFNCDSLTDDLVNTLTDRICANLMLQRSDSLLKVSYDSLVVKLREVGDDTLVTAFENLQRSWRQYRNRHCDVQIGEIVGNGSAAAYMHEMRLLTDIRTEELKRLLTLYRYEY